MGRRAISYLINADAAAALLKRDVIDVYRLAREGRLRGVVHRDPDERGPSLLFDRRKLAIIERPHGNRIHEPGSGRTQVVHSPAELKAWLAQAKEDGATSLASWLRSLANKRAGVKS